MSALLSQLEGRERRAECLRNDEFMRASDAWPCIGGCWMNNGEPCGQCEASRESLRAFFAECEADARDVMRGAA